MKSNKSRKRKCNYKNFEIPAIIKKKFGCMSISSRKKSGKWRKITLDFLEL